jgi:rhodanese-related sulfurtransferase
MALKTAVQAGLILAVSGLLAVVHGLLAGGGVFAGPSREGAITLAELSREEAAVIWVDARDDDAFQAGHQRGAVRLNEDNWESALGDLLVRWEPGVQIVVYCDGAGCAASREIALRLRAELGFEGIHWLEGGWESLQAGGQP